MNQDLYLKYIREYTLEVLEKAGKDISLAADYLEKKSKPSIFVKDRREKRAALNRVRKVFADSRGRSPYVVLKSLGLDDLAKNTL
jgi:hypothetical protein